MALLKTHRLTTRYTACAALAMWVAQGSVAQNSAPSATTPAPFSHAAETPSALAVKPQWRDLTETQRATLKPLAASWDALEVARKRKWLSLAQSYANLTPAERAKLQSRMAEWAALSPHERTLARLNFAETKKVAPSERSANWDAYQALSPAERQKFADQAANRPKGAAIAAKPALENKITPVPVTRHTPAQGASTPAIAIDRKTLLPQAPRPAVAVSAPVN